MVRELGLVSHDYHFRAFLTESRASSISHWFSPFSGNIRYYMRAGTLELYAILRDSGYNCLADWGKTYSIRPRPITFKMALSLIFDTLQCAALKSLISVSRYRPCHKFLLFYEAFSWAWFRLILHQVCNRKTWANFHASNAFDEASLQDK